METHLFHGSIHPPNSPMDGWGQTTAPHPHPPAHPAPVCASPLSTTLPTTQAEALAGVDSALLAVKMLGEHHLPHCIECLVGGRAPVRGKPDDDPDTVAAAATVEGIAKVDLLSDDRATSTSSTARTGRDVDKAVDYLRRANTITALAMKHIDLAVPVLSRLVDPKELARLAVLTEGFAYLGVEGVQDLVLVNRPWPQDVPLPAMLFGVSTLTRLYIGLWKLPSTDVLRGACFPHLVELGICSVEMEHDAVESVVVRSPVLEILNIEGCRRELRLRLVSHSLRCVQIYSSVVESVTMENFSPG